MTISRVYTALIAAAVAIMALPTTASAGCYNCYAPPPPCGTCYQRQVVPPRCRTVEETVMVAPGATIAHRTPAQYRTVMVPQTVMSRLKACNTSRFRRNMRSASASSWSPPRANIT